MKLIKNKPCALFLITIPIIMVLGLIGQHRYVDIQLGDTYYVISTFHFALLFSIILAINAFLFWLFRNKNLTPLIFKLHALTIIMCYIFIIILTLSFKNLILLNPQAFNVVNQLVFGLLMFSAVSLIVFVVNLFRSKNSV